MDSPGIGDSSGALREGEDFRRLITENTQLSRDLAGYLRSEAGLDVIGLCGLCSGAMNALFMAAADPSLAFSILLGMPVDPMQDYSGEASAQFALRIYLRKLFRWRSWWNLLLLRSQFGIMRGALAQLFNPRRRAMAIDESIWNAFLSVVSRKDKLLLLYGEHDVVYAGFCGEFRRRLSGLPDSQRSCFAHVRHLARQRRRRIQVREIGGRSPRRPGLPGGARRAS